MHFKHKDTNKLKMKERVKAYHGKIKEKKSGSTKLIDNIFQSKDNDQNNNMIILNIYLINNRNT
jgi:hypothetical protein